MAEDIRTMPVPADAAFHVAYAEADCVLLDLVGYHDAATIGIYSSVAVFTICVISLVMQLRSGFDFDRKVALWAVDASFLPAVVLPAVASGMFGTQVNRRASDVAVRRTYLPVMLALLGLSAWNYVRGLGWVR